MKDNKKSKEILVRLPVEIVPWLEMRAQKNNRSRVGEITSIISTRYRHDMKRVENKEVAK